MPNKGMRWELIAVSAVVTLAVLSLAYYSYESIGVRRPLERSLLTDPDVSGAALRREAGKDVVEVTLSRVSDLSVAYSRIRALIADRAGRGAFSLVLKDQRDAALSRMYHDIHYYLEEASVQGNFGRMIEACEPVLLESGASGHKITVDDSFIYVQIELGDQYLYQVLERSPSAGGGAAR